MDIRIKIIIPFAIISLGICAYFLFDNKQEVGNGQIEPIAEEEPAVETANKETWTSDVRRYDLPDGKYKIIFGKQNYYDGAEYQKVEDIEAELAFPEGKEINAGEDLKLFDCPTWATCELKNEGQELQIIDGKGNLIFEYKDASVAQEVPSDGTLGGGVDSETSVLKSVDATYEIRNREVYFKYPDEADFIGKVKVYDDVYSSSGGDGYSGQINNTNIWSTCHDASKGTVVANSSTFPSSVALRAADIAGRFDINRAFFPFNTSAIPDDCVITSAVLSVKNNTVWDDDNDGNDYLSVVCPTTQPSTTTLSTDDYRRCSTANTPRVCSNNVDVSTISVNTFTDFTLNTTGTQAVSFTTTTMLGLREGHDIADSAINVTGTVGIQALGSLQSGTSNDPYFTVVCQSTPAATTTTRRILIDLEE